LYWRSRIPTLRSRTTLIWNVRSRFYYQNDKLYYLRVSSAYNVYICTEALLVTLWQWRSIVRNTSAAVKYTHTHTHLSWPCRRPTKQIASSMIFTGAQKEVQKIHYIWSIKQKFSVKFASYLSRYCRYHTRTSV